MNSEKYIWCIWALGKFAFLGIPAAGILWFWRKKGPDCRALYYASWSNICVYLLWLTAMLFMSMVSGSQAYRDWINYSGLTGALAFFIPFLLSFGSLVLCFLVIIAKQKERPYFVLFNMLMLILWIVSVVPPN